MAAATVGAVAAIGMLASCATPGTGQAARPGSRVGTTASSGLPSPVAIAPSTGVAAQQTQLRTYSPYAATGTLAVPVADHVSGTCWAGSVAVPVAGAYRCFAGNNILDPCFASAGAAPATLVCVDDPWSAAHLLTLTKPLPRTAPASGTGFPWALELANGAKCVAATGTVDEVIGISLNYICPDASAAGIMRGSQAPVIAEYGKRSGTTLTEVAVTTEWMG